MKKQSILVICIVMALSVLASCGKIESGSVNAEQDNKPENITDGAYTVTSYDEEVNGKTIIPEAGHGPGNGGAYFYETYIQKDVDTELDIPECPDIKDGGELHMFKCRTESTTDKLKAQYEEFIGYYDIDCKEAVVTEENDTVCEMSIPTGKGEVTGTFDDMYSGSAVIIRSMPHRFTVSYLCSEEICENRADIGAMTKYLLEEPSIKAICGYLKIEKPALRQSINYNIYGSPITEYFLYDEGTEPYKTAEKYVFAAVFEHQTITILFNPREPFESDEVCPAIGVETAVKSFCEKNGVEQDCIYKMGFMYLDSLYPNFPYSIPCYVIVCRGNDEFAKANKMDLSVNQEWDTYIVPAIEMPEKYEYFNGQK